MEPRADFDSESASCCRMSKNFPDDNILSGSVVGCFDVENPKPIPAAVHPPHFDAVHPPHDANSEMSVGAEGPDGVEADHSTGIEVIGYANGDCGHLEGEMHHTVLPFAEFGLPDTTRCSQPDLINVVQQQLSFQFGCDMEPRADFDSESASCCRMSKNFPDG